MKLLNNNQQLAGAFIAGAILTAAGIICLHAAKTRKADARFLTRYNTNPEADTEGAFTHFFQAENEQE